LDDELLKINNLHCKYLTKNSFFESNKKYFNALKNIDITLNQGETIGIVGESGSGKTTLAMAILQLLRYEGEITFLGKNLNECTDSELRKIRNQFQIVFQDPYSSLSPRMTIRQILSEGIVEYENISSSKLNERCELLIKEVGLDPIMLDRYPHQFSGGQRQRIAIARALSLRPKMIIFDEPTSALDVIVQKNILDLIVSLQEKYSISYVFITHDLKVIRAISHRTYVLRDAEIVESNLTEDLLSSPSNEYTKKLIDSSFIN
jgi:microcin C transport system ATP-binding protein